MCEPAPPEREELARVVSLPTSQKLSYRSTRVLKGTQTQTLFTNVHNSMAPHSLSCLSANSTKRVPSMAGILLSHEEVRGTDMTTQMDLESMMLTKRSQT